MPPGHPRARDAPLLATVTAAVGTLLLAAAIADAARTNPRAMSPVCVPYSDFTEYRSSQRCFYANACYVTDLCCPANNSAADECIDATTFRCDPAATCAALTGPDGGYTPTDVYLRALGGGESLQCCPRAATPTPAPSVPPLDEEEASAGSGGSNGSSADDNTPPRPVDEDCGDPMACQPNLAFARIIRTLCPELPAPYGDEFLNANLPLMCCYFTNTTPPGALTPSGRDYGCGGQLLDLPRVATYHCNFDLRGTQTCCNGRVDNPEASGSTAAAGEGEQNRASDMITSRSSLMYTYLGNQCTGRMVYPDTRGDGAASPMVVTHTALAAVVGLLGLLACMPAAP